MLVAKRAPKEFIAGTWDFLVSPSTEAPILGRRVAGAVMVVPMLR